MIFSLNINMKLYKAIGNPPTHPADGQPGSQAAGPWAEETATTLGAARCPYYLGH